MWVWLLAVVSEAAAAALCCDVGGDFRGDLGDRCQEWLRALIWTDGEQDRNTVDEINMEFCVDEINMV